VFEAEKSSFRREPSFSLNKQLDQFVLLSRGVWQGIANLMILLYEAKESEKKKNRRFRLSKVDSKSTTPPTDSINSTTTFLSSVFMTNPSQRAFEKDLYT